MDNPNLASDAISMSESSTTANTKKKASKDDAGGDAMIKKKLKVLK